MCLHCPIMINYVFNTNEYINVLINITSIILYCFLQYCISMQLLLLCGDIETNSGLTTKVCPECSFNIKVSMCPCGYSFKSAKNVTTVCPQCSSLIHIKKSICLCGYTFETSHSNDCSVREIPMRKKQALETGSETNERRAKSRKCMSEKRASESQDLAAAR